jgi:hypothetical protein
MKQRRIKSWLLLLSAILLVSCATEIIEEGYWKAELKTDNSQLVPFWVEVNESRVYLDISILNLEDTIRLSSEVNGDSIILDFPNTNSQIRARIVSKRQLKGYWLNYSIETPRLPFSASHSAELTDADFKITSEPTDLLIFDTK